MRLHRAVELVLLHCCIIGSDGKGVVLLYRRKELTRGRKTLDADELHDCTARSYYLGDQTKENETYGTCGQCGGNSALVGKR